MSRETATMPRITKRLSGPTLVLILTAALLVISPAAARPEGAPTAATSVAVATRAAMQPAVVTIDLCATTGSVGLPGGATIPIWGFVPGSTCTAGDATLPGPELRVNAGDIVTINLTNMLAEPTSVLIPGQDVMATAGTPGTLTSEAAASGGTASYVFTAQEGSYLYESGTDADIQVAMGLSGPLIVDSGAVGSSYGHLHDTDEVLVLSEIDPVLNANPAGFDMLDYHPVYWLMNGAAYPDTAAINADEGQRVLVRYLNAGYQNLSMTTLGSHQQIIAKNGYAAPTPIDAVAEIIPAGQTADMIVNTVGLGGTSVAIYNRNMNVTNDGVFPGGMLTFIEVAVPVGNSPTAAIVAPTDGSTVAGIQLVQIDATDIEDAVGSLTVEWRIVGAPTWESAAYNGGSGYYESAAGTWDTTLEPDGSAQIEVRATDSDLNTTPATTVTVEIDNMDDPPTVTIFAPPDGSLVTDSLMVEANAEDDRGVMQVEFFADATSLGIDTDGNDGWSAAWDTSLGSDGAHTLTATATDSGAQSTTSAGVGVTVDNTAPSVGITTPTSGDTVTGLVTIAAAASDATSGVAAVEFFVDGGSIGADVDGGDGWTVDWDTTGLNSGPFVLTATATDSVGLTATSADVSVTVDNPVQATLHVGNLDATTVLQRAGQNNERWRATVTATVHDVPEGLVDGATVEFEVARISKASGNTQTSTASCATGAGGTCAVVTQWFRSSNVEDIITVTVTGVTHAGLSYEQPDNHDPDPDPGADVVDNLFSDGTTIEVEIHRP